MWRRTLQAASRRTWQQTRRTAPFQRTYNGSTHQGPHTTYFQQPPPQQPSRGWRIFRTLVWSGACFTLGAGSIIWILRLPVDLEVLGEGQLQEMAEDVMAAGTSDVAARRVEPLTVETATELLQSRSGYSVCPKAVAHTSQLPSNLPCEDTWSSGAFTLFDDKDKDWYEWAVFDGHAGPRTAEALKQFLPSIVGGDLWAAKCMDQPYVPNDLHTIGVIKKTFQNLDKDLIEGSAKLIQSNSSPLAEKVAAGVAAYSGSCALLALYDPVRSVLRVANVGDSRAVLGRFDNQSKKYVAVPMSVDQTGFNAEEVSRLEREHPGESVVDPKTGRVHGIAVSRAFGDSRWKWTESLTQRAHMFVFGPSPRPNGVIKTPPYLTAEPEIQEARIQTGDRPDFLIMASDGLWDNITSEDAVSCVELWLEKNKPTNFLEESKQTGFWGGLFGQGSASARLPTYSSPSDLDSDDDTYWDEEEKCLKWRVSPKHFINEDEHCGIHLIKNALGGKRRDLFTGLMTIQPPLSRHVRDDITVHVIFFGVDTQDMIKN